MKKHSIIKRVILIVIVIAAGIALYLYKDLLLSKLFPPSTITKDGMPVPRNKNDILPPDSINAPSTDFTSRGNNTSAGGIIISDAPPDTGNQGTDAAIAAFQQNMINLGYHWDGSRWIK